MSKLKNDGLDELRAECVCHLRNGIFCFQHFTSTELFKRDWIGWRNDEMNQNIAEAKAFLSQGELTVQEACGADPRLVYYGPLTRDAIFEAAPMSPNKSYGYVYHLLDRWDRVLYVGKSHRPASRVFDHQKKTWWSDVISVRIIASFEYDWLERGDIKQLKPLYNIIYNV